MRIRTADILLAKQTLYQLSYTPFQSGRIVFYEWRRKRNELCAALLERADFFSCFRCSPCGLATPDEQAHRGSTYSRDAS